MNDLINLEDVIFTITYCNKNFVQRFEFNSQTEFKFEDFENKELSNWLECYWVRFFDYRNPYWNNKDYNNPYWVINIKNTNYSFRLYSCFNLINEIKITVKWINMFWRYQFL